MVNGGYAGDINAGEAAQSDACGVVQGEEGAVMNGKHDPASLAASHYDAPARPWKLPAAGGAVLTLVLGFWSLGLALVSAGWLALPAKETDLQGLAGDVATVKADLVRIGADVRETREDLIWVKALLAAPAATPKKKRRPNFATTTE